MTVYHARQSRFLHRLIHTIRAVIHRIGAELGDKHLAGQPRTSENQGGQSNARRFAL